MSRGCLNGYGVGDGTAGLKNARAAGGKNVCAGCRKLCCLWNALKSAVEAEVIDRQLPLAAMANEINDFLSRRKET